MKIVSDPLVSIVIPCYNHQKFIKRCLDSVAAQTYEKLEVIIIDDCSSDNSVLQIEQLIQRESWKTRFSTNNTLLHKLTANQGAHAAINYGISQSKGNIITILNSDDMYHPNRLKNIVNIMQSYGHEFVFSKVEYIDENDRNITQSHPVANRYFSIQQLIEQYPSVGFAALISNVGISTGNFVFTKDLFARVSEFSSYRYCHDWDFLLRCLLYTEPFYLNQNLYYYRFHGKNTFESLESIGDEESTKILTSILAKMQNHKLTNRLAPSPLNWPSYFELFLYWFNFKRYLQV
jgi:glycosyltransferase involved in cell wall biosynthesis